MSPGRFSIGEVSTDQDGVRCKFGLFQVGAEECTSRAVTC